MMGKKEIEIIVEEEFKNKDKKERKEKINRILLDVIKQSTQSAS